MLLNREPAMYLGAFGAILSVLIGFGLPITPGQVGLVMAAVSAILAVLVRANVSPVTAGTSPAVTSAIPSPLTVHLVSSAPPAEVVPREADRNAGLGRTV